MKKTRISIIALIMTVIIIGLIIFISQNKVILKLIYPLKYNEEVYKYSKEYKLDPLLVYAVIKAESNFDRYAVSAKGAKGLMQVTDSTGSWAAEKIGLEDFAPANLFIPEVNIKIGCWYLNTLRKQFNGDIKLVITAYNSGGGRVKGWLKDDSLSSTGKKLEKIPFEETDNYVKKVLREYKILRYIYSK